MNELTKSRPSNGFHTAGTLRLLAACRILGLAHRKVDLPRDHITDALDLDVILVRAKQAYRALTRQHHVDHGGSASDHRLIIVAYHRIKFLCAPRPLAPCAKPLVVDKERQARALARWDTKTPAELAAHGRRVSKGRSKGK